VFDGTKINTIKVKCIKKTAVSSVTFGFPCYLWFFVILKEKKICFNKISKKEDFKRNTLYITILTRCFESMEGTVNPALHSQKYLFIFSCIL